LPPLGPIRIGYLVPSVDMWYSPVSIPGLAFLEIGYSRVVVSILIGTDVWAKESANPSNKM